MPPAVEIYTVPFCGYCIRAKRLLEARGVTYAEYDTSTDESAMVRLQNSGARRTFPQIFINGENIGGCDDLYRLDRDGSLDRLLDAKPAGDRPGPSSG